MSVLLTDSQQFPESVDRWAQQHHVVCITDIVYKTLSQATDTFTAEPSDRGLNVSVSSTPFHTPHSSPYLRAR